MVLTGVAAIGSQSRGGLVAMVAMGIFLWLKSRNKFITTIYMAASVAIIASVMPQEWYDRMNTINTYQEDQSTQGRINAWHTAFNVAKDRVTGGGLSCGTRRFSVSTHLIHSTCVMCTVFISKSWVSRVSSALACSCCWGG